MKKSRSKNNSGSQQNQQDIVGVDKKSTISVESSNQNLSDYSSSLQQYHLQNYPIALQHSQNQFRRSVGNLGETHRFPSLRATQSFRHKPVDISFQSPRPVTPAAENHSLNLERTYLLSSLKREDERATDMLQKIRLIQQYLDLPFNSVNSHQKGEDSRSESVKKANSEQELLTRPLPQINKRKLTRHLNHLKNRLSEITKSEKSMLARLEQVTGKLPNQEKWRPFNEEEQMEEDIWGFADAVNLHNYGWKFGGVGDINGLGGFHMEANTEMMNDAASGTDTPRSGVSPGAQTPVESLVEVEIPVKKHLDPRSPSFVPRTPLSNKQRQHSLIDWADPRYKHIMDDVKSRQSQSAGNDEDPVPSVFPPIQTRRRSSLIDWSEPQYSHVLKEVRQTREQRAQNVPGLRRVEIHKVPERHSMHASIIELDSEEISPISLPRIVPGLRRVEIHETPERHSMHALVAELGNEEPQRVPGLRRVEIREEPERHSMYASVAEFDNEEPQQVPGLRQVEIHELPERRSLHASIAGLDSQETSPVSLLSPSSFGSTSTETAVPSVEAPISTSRRNGLELDRQETPAAANALLHEENYQTGLAKIRAASVATKQTFRDLEESDDEDEKSFVGKILRSS